MSVPNRSRAYTTTLEALAKGKARVPVPFDPNDVWGTKLEHHVGGTIAGLAVRGTIVRDASGWSFSLGPAWLRDCPVGPGHRVEVIIAPEGPQRGDLAPDVAAALEANPAAGEFFDALAQFYRRAYLRWIDATKRRPEQRAERIAEVARLLSEGIRQRPGEP
jgi:Bacteriocin-protection, YdeI or OmpD-Associated